MYLFERFVRLTHPKKKFGWEETTAYFTGDVRKVAAGAGAQFGLSGRNEYMIRFFTDAGERNAWYSFYPLEDPAPEDVYGMEMKIRYKKRRPWMIEHIL